MIHLGSTAILCSRHGKKPRENGFYREYVMQKGMVISPKTKDSQEIKNEFLYCSRCFQTVPMTSELQELLDGFAHGNRTTVINKSDITETNSDISIGK